MNPFYLSLISKDIMSLIGGYPCLHKRWISVAVLCGLLVGGNSALMPAFGQSSALEATGTSFYGQIRDMYTQAPISSVKVTVSDIQEVWADQQGIFTLEKVPAGTYALTFQRSGYQSVNIQVNIGEFQADSFLIRLRPTTYTFNEDVVLTAQRTQQDPLKSAQSLTLIDQQAMFELGSRTLPEVMMGATGIWVQKTNHGGGSPFVRGLTGHQTLLLLDGIRLNNSTYRSGPNQYANTVDHLMLDRIEVVRGSGSVQYGSDALGGAINLLTRSPSFSPQGLVVHGGATARYASDLIASETEILEQTLRGEFSLATSNVATSLGINVKRYGDIIAGDTLGRQAPSGYDQVDADFKSILKVGDRNVLTLAYNQTTQSEVGRYDQVSQLGTYDIYEFDPQSRQLAYLRLAHQGNRPGLGRITGTLSFQQSAEGRRKRRTGASDLVYERDEVRTLGATLEHQGQWGSNWTAVSGLEVYADEITSMQELRLGDDSVVVQRGLYPDQSSAFNLGGFSLHRWQQQAWTLEAGLRINLVQVTAPDEEFGDIQTNPVAIVGNVGMNYMIKQGQHLFAHVNTGFRAPNLNDLTSFGSFDSGFEIPNPDLKPERTLSGEIGYKARTDKFAATFSAYYTRLFQLMVRQRSNFEGDTLYQDQRVFQKINLDQAYIYGLEASLEYRLVGPLSIYGQASYTFGGDESNAPLRRIPPFNGRFGLALRQPQGYFIRVENWWAADQTRLSSGDINDHRIPAGGTPGFFVVNLHAGYQLRWVQASLTVQNLFNEAYRFHGSGVDASGRSVWITFAANF